MLNRPYSQLNTSVFTPRAGHISVSRRDLHVQPEEARITQLGALIDHYDKLACHDGYEAAKALEVYNAAVDDRLLPVTINALWDEYISRCNTAQDAKEKRDAHKAELIKLQAGGKS